MKLIKKSYFQLFITLFFILNITPCYSAKYQYKLKTDNNSNFSIKFQNSINFSNVGSLQRIICQPTIKLNPKNDNYVFLSWVDTSNNNFLFLGHNDNKGKILKIELIFSKGFREFFKKETIEKKYIVIENTETNDIQEIVNKYLLEKELIKDNISVKIIGSAFTETFHTLFFFIELIEGPPSKQAMSEPEEQVDEVNSSPPNDKNLVIVLCILLILLLFIVLFLLIINLFKGKPTKKKKIEIDFTNAKQIYFEIEQALKTRKGPDIIDNYYNFLIKPLAEKFNRENNSLFKIIYKLLLKQSYFNKIDLIVNEFENPNFQNLNLTEFDHNLSGQENDTIQNFIKHLTTDQFQNSTLEKEQLKEIQEIIQSIKEGISSKKNISIIFKETTLMDSNIKQAFEELIEKNLNPLINLQNTIAKVDISWNEFKQNNILPDLSYISLRNLQFIQEIIDILGQLNYFFNSMKQIKISDDNTKFWEDGSFSYLTDNITKTHNELENLKDIISKIHNRIRIDKKNTSIVSKINQLEDKETIRYINEIDSFIIENLNQDLTELNLINAALKQFNNFWNERRNKSSVSEEDTLSIIKNIDKLKFIQEMITFLNNINTFSNSLTNKTNKFDMSLIKNGFPKLPDVIVDKCMSVDFLESKIDNYKNELEELNNIKNQIIPILNQLPGINLVSSINNSHLTKELDIISTQNIRFQTYESYRDDLIETINSLKEVTPIPTLVYNEKLISALLNKIYEKMDEIKDDEIKRGKAFARNYVKIITNIRNILWWILFFQLKTSPEFIYLLTKANRIIENMSDLYGIQFDVLPFRQIDKEQDEVLYVPYNSQTAYKKILIFKFLSILAFLEYEEHTPVSKDEFDFIFSSNKAERQAKLNNKIDAFLKNNTEIENIEIFSLMELAELGYTEKSSDFDRKSRIIINKKDDPS